MKRLLFSLYILGALGAQLYAEHPVLIEQRYYSFDEAMENVYGQYSHVADESVNVTGNLRDIVEEDLGYDIGIETATLYTVFDQKKLLGYALVLDELGKYYPITFLVAVQPDFSVKDVVVMVYREKIGKAVRKKRFLKQFRKKSKEDPIIVDQDITGITGATVSAWTISSGVRKAIVLTEAIVKTQFSDDRKEVVSKSQ